MTVTVDLNADLGEGFGRWQLGDDDALLKCVTSANVACGFHAGDPSVMRRVCARAAELGVAVGAHVAYPDLQGFGRRFLDMAPEELADAVTYQIGALDALARAAGTRVTYVKCHGALYHACNDHRGQAEAVVCAVATLDRSLVILGAPGSTLLDEAHRQQLPTAVEAFVDRAYHADGRLMSRQHPEAVLTSVDEVTRRAVSLAMHGGVTSVEGSWVPLRAASLCLHGDTPGAVALAGAVRHALVEAGVALRPFAAA